METVRAQIQEDQIAELSGASEIARILQRKLVGKYIPGFFGIVGPKETSPVSPAVAKVFLLGFNNLLTNKIKEVKAFALRNLILQYGTGTSEVN